MASTDASMSSPRVLLGAAAVAAGLATRCCHSSRSFLTPMWWAEASLTKQSQLSSATQLRPSTGAEPVSGRLAAPGPVNAAVGAAALALVAGVGSRQRSQRRVQRHALTDEQDLSVESLLSKYSSDVKAIRKACAVGEDKDDIALLRFVIEAKGDVAAAVKNYKEVQEWRQGKGKGIVEAAAKAIEKALAGGKWDNEPVLAGAPHSAKISKYITGSQIMIVNMPNGDLCSVIRASAIDDKAMMDEVKVPEMIEFFLYCREVNYTVAEMRTRKSGKLIKLLAANDLSGVSKFPDGRFQEALTGSSKEATTLYPGLTGPTVILNLPGIVRMLVQFLKPLFPGPVQQKIKFAKGPMAYIKDLTDLQKEPTKSMFIGDLEAVIKA